MRGGARKEMFMIVLLDGVVSWGVERGKDVPRVNRYHRINVCGLLYGCFIFILRICKALDDQQKRASIVCRRTF